MIGVYVMIYLYPTSNMLCKDYAFTDFSESCKMYVMCCSKCKLNQECLNELTNDEPITNSRFQLYIRGVKVIEHSNSSVVNWNLFEYINNHYDCLSVIEYIEDVWTGCGITSDKCIYLDFVYDTYEQLYMNKIRRVCDNILII